MVDMKHMEFIDRVAAADCDVLREKEGTYKGSWKAAGGRSAWFMMRRNMDRLLNMMQKPESPSYFNLRNVDDTINAIVNAEEKHEVLHAYLPGSREATAEILKYLRASYVSENIFAMVRDNASGDDGTVLAVLRDLRRYLILIEAEMMARGVVPAPPGLDKDDLTVLNDWKEKMREEIRREPITKCSVVLVLLRPDGGSDHQYEFPNAESVVIESEPGKLTLRVKPGLHTAETLSDYLDPDLSLRLNKDPDPRTTHHVPTDTRELNPHFDAVISEGVVHERGREPRTATAEDRASAAQAMSERRVPRYDEMVELIEQRTPEDGAQHASLTPWEVDGATIVRWAIGDPMRHELFEKFYKRHGQDIYRLETTVESVDIPRELSACYAPKRFDGWVVRVERVPDELRESYPRLQVEMNAVEYEQSLMEFRYMYELRGEKWILMPSYAAWARET